MSRDEARAALIGDEVLDWDTTVGGRAMWIAVRVNSSGATTSVRVLGPKQ